MTPREQAYAWYRDLVDLRIAVHSIVFIRAGSHYETYDNGAGTVCSELGFVVQRFELPIALDPTTYPPATVRYVRFNEHEIPEVVAQLRAKRFRVMTATVPA